MKQYLRYLITAALSGHRRVRCLSGTSATISGDRGRSPRKCSTMLLQSGASYLSQGFEDDVLEGSPGWLAATVSTYCPGRPSQLTWKNITKCLTEKEAQLCIDSMSHILRCPRFRLWFRLESVPFDWEKLVLNVPAHTSSYPRGNILIWWDAGAFLTLTGFKLEVAWFQFLRIVIPVPRGIFEELEPELQSKEL